MKKIILVIPILMLIILMFNNLGNVYGYSVDYENFGPRIKKPPNVCVIIPETDNYLNENTLERFLKESRNAILEWENHLKSKADKFRYNWEINYIQIPVEKQDGYNYSECDVFIHFQPKPDDPNDWYKKVGESIFEVGSTGRATIIAYYNAIETCITEDAKYVYYDPCYSDINTRTSDQIGTLIRHEFGHTLGLGHYISDNDDLNLQWAKGENPPPSIMVIFSNENTEQTRILPYDVEQVFSMYGLEGFNLSKEKEKIIFESISVQKEQYIVIPYEITTVSIFGNIAEGYVLKGIPVFLTIIKPDETNEEIKSAVSDDGSFEINYLIDTSSSTGTYRLQASYRDYLSDDFFFDVSLEERITLESSEKIPNWIKKIAKSWSNDKIDENDFVSGIQYLVDEEIIHVSPTNLEQIHYSRNVPSWIKISTSWWAEGLISEDEYLNGIQFLIENGHMWLR